MKWEPYEDNVLLLNEADDSTNRIKKNKRNDKNQTFK